jgi:hypothetical protein
MGKGTELNNFIRRFRYIFKMQQLYVITIEAQEKVSAMYILKLARLSIG